MKSKYVLLASALLISVATFAQKDQIKAAEKAIKAGKSQEAATILMEAESLMSTASETEKAQFFFVKGNALLDLANKKVSADKNLELATAAYQNLIEVEKATGKSKYTSQAQTSLKDIKFNLINSAIADSKVDKHAESAKKLYDAYLLDKKDTINLYYAASTYVNAKEYSKALEMYENLKKLNYSGKGKSYFAINKLTSGEDFFDNVKERDLSVKIGTHEKPRNEDVASKRGEIYKNMALILVENGKTEEAKKAISEARMANPDDNSLVLTEANLYLETKDFETYKKLIGEVLAKNPNDADLTFNLGVISGTAGNMAEAEKYYSRAIEIKPDYINAYINLAALKLDGEKVIIDEMNKLGTSTKDMKRYDELKIKRDNIFKSVIPSLKKAYELDTANVDVAKTLLNVYSALEMTAESKALKAKMQ
ncbi:tetratricopeptide (TPR) repeat protein [Flavobacterium sp. PL11]|uniref:tetratricopeptide repeat protein n=1 Tax=Flavobacterium sp. PL11 TaxID=3071717 RepID=UPI002DFACE22|nr:tetratricopeptide (TPR) repeat protein [Flavobacterium sp. PL11]